MDAFLELVQLPEATADQWMADAEELQTALANGEAQSVFQVCWADESVRTAVLAPFKKNEADLKLWLDATPKLQTRIATL